MHLRIFGVSTDLHAQEGAVKAQEHACVVFGDGHFIDLDKSKVYLFGIGNDDFILGRICFVLGIDQRQATQVDRV
ncbi:hypothetical protein D3C72_1060250 [compost metagenome]